MIYTDVVSIVSSGEHGAAKIVHDIPDKFERMMAGLRGMPLNRDVYVRLIVNGQVLMTDAEFERASNRKLLEHASGHALIAGLGIGLILHPLLKLCSSVTVIEKEADVIALVAPRFPEVRVVHADIWEWKPPSMMRYGTIYFDIWPHFNSDITKQATKLRRQFRSYLREGGWMGSWPVEAQRLRR